MDKILFLDFDGVLNDCSHYNIPKELFDEKNSRAFRESRNYIYETLKDYDSKELSLHAVSELEHSKVMLLNRIVRDTDCKIVFSTAWRYSGVKLLSLYLAIVGFRYPLNCIDRIGFNGCRGEQIQDWLDRNKDKWNDYVVLDDEMCDIEEFHESERLFKTDGIKNGLTEEIANNIILYFNRVLN